MSHPVGLHREASEPSSACTHVEATTSSFFIFFFIFFFTFFFSLSFFPIPDLNPGRLSRLGVFVVGAHALQNHLGSFTASHGEPEAAAVEASALRSELHLQSGRRRRVTLRGMILRLSLRGRPGVDLLRDPLDTWPPGWSGGRRSTVLEV